MEKNPPNLVALPSSTRARPPATLGEAGSSLWNRVQIEYDIRDCGGLEMLAQACHAADRAARLKAQIDKDGEVIRGRSGIRAHPALKEELACRGFIVRTLHRLGLDVEAVRPLGRPGTAIGWIPPA
jgi:hypothetical protein